MIDRDKISQDIGMLRDKHGSFRAVAKVTGINKASLENYFDKTTEPREKNILKLASSMHKDPSSYYTGAAEAPLPAPSDTVTLRDIIKLHEEIHKLATEIGSIKDLLLVTLVPAGFEIGQMDVVEIVDLGV